MDGSQPPAGLSLARAEPVAVTVEVAPLTLRQSLRVPVTLQNVGEDVYLASDVPIVELTANGPAEDGLNPSEVQASVNAAGPGWSMYVDLISYRWPDMTAGIVPHPSRPRLGRAACELPAAGHWPHEEAPDQVLAAVRAFLECR